MAKGFMSPDGITTDHASWTASTGTKQSCIDEPALAPNDADHIQCAVSSSLIRFSLSAPPSMSACNGVALKYRAALLQGSLSPVIRLGLRVGGTDYMGIQRSVLHSFVVPYEDLYPVNPATLAAWTESELGSVELVVTCDLNDGTSVSRLTQAYLEPDYVATPTKLEAARRRATVRLLIRRAVADGQYRGRF